MKPINQSAEQGRIFFQCMKHVLEATVKVNTSVGKMEIEALCKNKVKATENRENNKPIHRPHLQWQ